MMSGSDCKERDSKTHVDRASRLLLNEPSKTYKLSQTTQAYPFSNTALFSCKNELLFEEMTSTKLTALFVALFFSSCVSLANQRSNTILSSIQLERTRRLSPIFSTEPDNGGGLGSDTPLPESSVCASEPEGTQYPLDVPSPILLASSMVLAIVGTGE